MPSIGSLSASQSTLLARWLPGHRVVRDLGWGLVDSVVLEVESGGKHYVVKADGPTNHHVARELTAHEQWLEPWVSAGRAPQLIAGDRAAKILLSEYLPGALVLDSPAQEEPDVFRQAGALLAALHAQQGGIDRDYEARENRKVLQNLEKPHRIAPEVATRLRRTIESWATPPVVVVPTHGDWQPRNWLIADGQVSAIDFGRAAMRPAITDWLRLDARDFRADPSREAAFVEGYGSDPREPEAWFRERLREAVNTAVWAHQVGDEAFEAQGHQMIERALTNRARQAGAAAESPRR
ncbi:aminoglycoside phosphotransferase family protein [Nocardioides sp. AE5]|uniref:aminoglycoside phosphotransferase family protein n=1 Tax=Nocardioides sp. AE5 TaxID=2962573 RepID=UPI00288274A3|nr:aminoglycoside phosphotransferase family protein [Nocardioides sp. AE5]MDT0203388.1 aminoglycoside phosphotransferase family protein [Nocardioides sp. AE5]